MMTSADLEQSLLLLGLSQTEAAQLLAVAPRTLRRWLEGGDLPNPDEVIPGPVEQAVRAWLKLHERKLPWRPDSASIADDDQDQIGRIRDHTVNLSDVISRVEARGGARVPWVVDRTRGRATFGPMEVTFYTLANGSFSPGNYTRKDGYPDVKRDQSLIEDAIYCIAKEFTTEVTLVWSDRPWRDGVAMLKQEKLPSKEAAIQKACASVGGPGFHDAFITAGKEALLDKHELRRECERRKDSAAALKAVAAYVFQHSDAFVTDGPRMLNTEQRQERRQNIEAVAKKIDGLGASAGRGEVVDYGQFETLLGELHRLGFFPLTSLVSAVARSFP
jgi:hypothetical protein